MVLDDGDSDVDHDSCDSNREDADQNDYPDEESDDRDNDSDEEAAARRYNKKMAQKQASGPTQWLERMRKKKDGATVTRTL